jgi:hypothetical protein
VLGLFGLPDRESRVFRFMVTSGIVTVKRDPLFDRIVETGEGEKSDSIELTGRYS